MSVGGSRQSNQNKSVNDATADVSPGEEQVAKCVREFVKEYPGRARLDLATGDRVQIREEYANVERVEWEADLRLPDPDTLLEPYDSFGDAPDPVQDRVNFLESLDHPSGERDGEVSPKRWSEGVRTLLEREAEVLRTTINLERRHLNDVEEYSVSAQSRWGSAYQKKYNAQIDGWLRELVGGDRPSGGCTAPSFDDPHIALITLSASSKPDGRRVGPVDHLEALQSSWRSTYHAMRNTLRSAGFDSSEWQYDRRAEPHKNERGDGRGINECYGHEHVILVVDGEVDAGDLRPVVEKHVEKNEWAGEEAHGEDAIEVRKPEELNDPAAYVADYCSIDPVGLFERDPAYQAWAAAATAANYRTVSRSDAARAAAVADKCRQRAESDKSFQEREHGERVRREGSDVVCSDCGSAHDIDQDQTLVEHRRPEPVSNPVVVDGGDELRTVESRSDELAERWPSALSGATVGESVERSKVRERVRLVGHAHDDLDGVEFAAKYNMLEHIDLVREIWSEVRSGAETDPDEVAGFHRGEGRPEWRMVSVTVDGEVYPASGGGSVTMLETTNYAERFSGFIAGDRWYRCDCGVRLYGEQMARHLGHAHGIEDRSKARRCTSAGMGYPDRCGDAGRVRSGGSGDSSGSVSWICSDCTCGVRIGNDCPVCGQSESEGATRV